MKILKHKPYLVVKESISSAFARWDIWNLYFAVPARTAREELSPRTLPRYSGITHPTDFPRPYPTPPYPCASNDPPMTSVAKFWSIWWSKTSRSFFFLYSAFEGFFSALIRYANTHWMVLFAQLRNVNGNLKRLHHIKEFVLCGKWINLIRDLSSLSSRICHAIPSASQFTPHIPTATV